MPRLTTVINVILFNIYYNLLRKVVLNTFCIEKIIIITYSYLNFSVSMKLIRVKPKKQI